MSKTVRYTLIIIFSICIPAAFLFFPAFFKVYIYSNSTESMFLYRTLENLIKYPDYLLHLIEYSEYNMLLQMVTFLLILFVCLLSFIFALARSKGGVIVTSALGLTATLAFIGFYQQNTSYYASYSTVVVGPGILFALILRIVNLILAATEKPEVVFPARAPYPPYPTYPIHPTTPTYPTTPAYPSNPTYPTSAAAPARPTTPPDRELAKTTANHKNTVKSTMKSAAQSDDLVSNWTQF